MGFEAVVTNHGRERIYDGSGGYWERGYTTELIALETTLSPGVGTSSSGDLLPADAIIEAVTARITTTLTDATEWALGDTVTTNRFSDLNGTIVAGTVVVGLNHVEPFGSPSVGATQRVAGKVVITTTTTPSAGVVRVTVYYSKFVAPTI